MRFWSLQLNFIDCYRNSAKSDVDVLKRYLILQKKILAVFSNVISQVLHTGRPKWNRSLIHISWLPANSSGQAEGMYNGSALSVDRPHLTPSCP